MNPILEQPPQPHRARNQPAHRHPRQPLLPRADAVAAGIDFIDTAHLYTSGESEAAIGAALAPFAPGLTVATKGAYNRGTGPDGLRAQIEESLERLRTETDRALLPAPHRP